MLVYTCILHIPGLTDLHVMLCDDITRSDRNEINGETNSIHLDTAAVNEVMAN